MASSHDGHRSRGSRSRKIAGEGDVEIQGRVDGDVAVDGEVTVERGGLVASNVNAPAYRRARRRERATSVAEESIALERRRARRGRRPALRAWPSGTARSSAATSRPGDASGAPRAAAARATSEARRRPQRRRHPPRPARAPRSRAASSNGSAARPAPASRRAVSRREREAPPLERSRCSRHDARGRLAACRSTARRRRWCPR